MICTCNTGAPVWPHMHKPPLIGGDTSDWRSNLWLEVSPPIGGETWLEVPPLIGGPTSDWGFTSNWRSHLWLESHLQSEVTPPIGGDTSDWEVPPLIGGVTSNWRSHLQLEVPPPIGGNTSNQRSHLWLEVPPPGGIFSYHLGWSQYLITSRIITRQRGTCNPREFITCNRFCMICLSEP